MTFSRIEAIERVEEKGVESIGEVYDMPLNKRHKMAKGVARACSAQRDWLQEMSLKLFY